LGGGVGAGPIDWVCGPAPLRPRGARDAAWWNETVLLSIQIESVQTVPNIARLVRPGITHVTWGPNDLEFSLELHPEYRLRTVEACMQNVAE
jgi:2-keto-3-deoxy-L-rhamnonate aldolase RhmA